MTATMPILRLAYHRRPGHLYRDRIEAVEFDKVRYYDLDLTPPSKLADPREHFGSMIREAREHGTVFIVLFNEDKCPYQAIYAPPMDDTTLGTLMHFLYLSLPESRYLRVIATRSGIDNTFVRYMDRIGDQHAFPLAGGIKAIVTDFVDFQA